MPKRPKIKIVLIPIDEETKQQETLEGPDALEGLLDRLMSEESRTTNGDVLRKIPNEEGGTTERSIHPDVAALLDELLRANENLRTRIHYIRQYT
jgi:hypothetical protein